MALAGLDVEIPDTAYCEILAVTVSYAYEKGIHSSTRVNMEALQGAVAWMKETLGIEYDGDTLAALLLLSQSLAVQHARQPRPEPDLTEH